MSDRKVECKVTEGDSAWMFSVTIDGQEVVRHFVSVQNGKILREQLGERITNLENECFRLSAGICENLYGDESGNPTCKFRIASRERCYCSLIAGQKYMCEPCVSTLKLKIAELERQVNGDNHDKD